MPATDSILFDGSKGSQLRQFRTHATKEAEAAERHGSSHSYEPISTLFAAAVNGRDKNGGVAARRPNAHGGRSRSTEQYKSGVIGLRSVQRLASPE